MKKLMLLVTVLVLSSCSTFVPMKMTCERTKSGELSLESTCGKEPKQTLNYNCKDASDKYEIGLSATCGNSKIECMCR